MKQKTLTIKSQAGLHARPAALFVQEAARFTSKIVIRKDEKEADAKSILGVLSLGAGYGAVITICADGEDEEEALERLCSILS